MPHLTTDDGVKLYYEEVGAGAPIVGCTTLGHKAPTTNPPWRVPRVLHCGITTSGREGLTGRGE